MVIPLLANQDLTPMLLGIDFLLLFFPYLVKFLQSAPLSLKKFFTMFRHTPGYRSTLEEDGMARCVVLPTDVAL